MPAPSQRRQIVSWALYDWGNSAFATTVMAGFFPLFFKQYWNAGVEASESTFRLGVANSIASLLVAVSAPLLGAVADRSGRRKRLLSLFAAVGASATAALYLAAKGDYVVAGILYATAAIGFSGSIVFYDSLLVSVAPREQSDRASALGYALGYLGGGLLFAVNVAMTLEPELFGLRDAAHAVRVSFVMVGLWWALFTLPLVLWVHEPRTPEVAVLRAIADGARELAHTFRRLRGMRPIWMFLLAYWLYIDGVDTVIRMAVDYGLSIGLASKDLIAALLITQFVGFPAALAFGRLGERIGTKRGILLGILVYVGVCGYGAQMSNAREFYVLAVVIGLVQGGVQALSRAYFSRLIPSEDAAQFFGFYNMLGKFAAILGPLLMGAVSYVTHSTRLSILSITLLFVLGGALLARVEPGQAAA